MKITELDWTEGKRYEANGVIYKVLVDKKYGTELVKEPNGYLTNQMALKDIVQLDFTEVVDWESITVDTPIWVRHTTTGDWITAHFCRYGAGGVFVVYYDGMTSHTTTRISNFKYASITDPTK